MVDLLDPDFEFRDVETDIEREGAAENFFADIGKHKGYRGSERKLNIHVYVTSNGVKWNWGKSCFVAIVVRILSILR